jgi:peptide/nickel transport system permease protein
MSDARQTDLSGRGDLPRARAWQRLVRSRSAWIGAILVGVFAFLALAAGIVAPYGRDEPSTRAGALPSLAHWLGTDPLRKDVLSRVIYGSRLSLLSGVVSILLAVSIGASMGATAGYFGGAADSVIMRGIDVALVFPSVLIALLVAAAWRPWD